MEAIEIACAVAALEFHYLIAILLLRFCLRLCRCRSCDKMKRAYIYLSRINTSSITCEKYFVCLPLKIDKTSEPKKRTETSDALSRARKKLING